jgi:hypothetical protein
MAGASPRATAASWLAHARLLRKSKGANSMHSTWRFLRNWSNGYALYLGLSRYGTSYWHAALVLAVMLLCFSWLFLFTGFQYTNQESAIINYDWGGSTPFFEILRDFWQSLISTMSIMTFQRERLLYPLGAHSQLLVVLATLVLTAQIALVLLAVRRRFRR